MDSSHAGASVQEDGGVLWAMLDEGRPLALAASPFNEQLVQLEPSTAPCGPSAAFVHWAEDGSLLAVANRDALNVFDVRPGSILQIRHRLPEANVSFVSTSPAGRWLCSWRKPIDESDANVAIYCCISGRCLVRRRRSKLGVRDNGEPVQFGADEQSAWIQQGSEVQGFDLDQLAAAAAASSPSHGASPVSAKFTWRLHVSGMTRFWLSPSKTKTRMLVLIPPRKAAPARVSIHEMPSLDAAVQSKSFFNADDVAVKWSPAGTGVLVLATEAHDSTGASYYGSSALYLLSADVSVPPITVCSPGTDGDVHDAAWNPSPAKKEFAVVCGRRAFICSGKNGKALLDLGTQGWNRVSWAPHGRFLMVGGFGNLPGNMWFFDRKEQVLLGAASDHGASPLGWTPDGRAMVAARAFPRRRVDNGFRVYSYAGEMLAEHKLDKVLHVGFVRSAGVAADRRGRAASPAALKRAKPLSAAALTQHKAAAYRPPTARDQSKRVSDTVASGVSAMLQKMRESSDRGPRAVASEAAPRETPKQDDDPEAAKRAARNRARRERKMRKASEVRAAKEAEQKMAEQARVDAEQGWEEVKSASKPSTPVQKKAPQDKLVKQITKKLRQIVSLRERQAAGEELDDDQLTKIGKDGELRQQLFAMGIVFQE